MNQTFSTQEENYHRSFQIKDKKIEEHKHDLVYHVKCAECN